MKEIPETSSGVFQTLSVVQEVRFFFTKIKNMELFLMISSYEKLYRKQPVEFPITEHIFGKSDLSLEKSDLNFIDLDLTSGVGSYVFRDHN